MMAGVTFVDSYVDEFGDTVYVDEDGNHWQMLDGDGDLLDDIDSDTLDDVDEGDDENDGGSYGPLNRFE